MAYRIVIVRSCLGRFTWWLYGPGNKIAEALTMHSSRYGCMKVVGPLSKKLKAKIEYIDLEKDYLS